MARLAAGDSDGAVRSAQAGLEIMESSLQLLELLHEAYQAKGDSEGELKTLQAFKCVKLKLFSKCKSAVRYLTSSNIRRIRESNCISNDMFINVEG